jgi:hypothetical protein
VLPHPLIEGQLLTVAEKATPLRESNGSLLKRWRRPNVRTPTRANDASWPKADQRLFGMSDFR